MANLFKTYQLIADILSFESDDASLKSQLQKNNQDWDSLVKVGSSHLVLPAIYCRLKTKKLLSFIPKDLESYLKQITQLNRERNVSIIDQANILAQLFEDHNIDYAFLKGVAILISDQYKDMAERMIGDIDILIAEKDLEKAFKLLENSSYQSIKQTLGNRFFEHKHLPRLTTEKYICAVELHKKLFISHQDYELTNTNILKKKSKYSNYYIPCEEHLLLHNILNYQINDKGNLFKEINFRSVYDTFIINNSYEIDLSSDKFNKKLIKQYYYRLNTFFKDFNNITTKKSGRFLAFKLKNNLFRKYWNKLLMVYSYLGELMKRLHIFITNNEYRKAVWKDKKRIINLLANRFSFKSTKGLIN